MLTSQLGRLPFSAEPSSSTASSSRGGIASSQRFWSASNSRQGSQSQWPSKNSPLRLALQAAAILAEVEPRNLNANSQRKDHAPELQIFQGFPEANGSLPAALYRLVDPNLPVDLPAPGTIKLTPADNRELDKLVAALGRNKATWIRAITLHEWLLEIGHQADDRLCTSLIRVCAQHGQATMALSLYDWMRASPVHGGAGLQCTVYTYTAAMRAALAGNMLDRAMEVWRDAENDHGHEIDCRLCTTLIEVCARRGDTEQALSVYKRMCSAPADSKLFPTVHAYTAAMRAAAEGGRHSVALAIWDDMQAAGCKPTGHAYSAVISACAAGGEWKRAVSLFDEMLAWGVKPDVVSCTALVTALGVDGQWERAEKVVEWMLRNDIRPNVRTYTALVGALANARLWDRASDIVRRMKNRTLGSGVEPNAYTYSALLKAMGDNGQWCMAEKVFSELEAEALAGLHEGKVVSSAEIAASAFDDSSESIEERLAAESLVTRMAELALHGPDDDLGNGKDGHSVNLQQALPAFSYFTSKDDIEEEDGKAGGKAPESPGSGAVRVFQEPHDRNGLVNAQVNTNGVWTSNNAAFCGLHVDLDAALGVGNSNGPVALVNRNGGKTEAISAVAMPRSPGKSRGVLNEVVCGALMLAYERAGRWREAVGVMDRARALGIEPNTVMYNTAISALGKAGKLEEARNLFDQCACPDAVTHETLIAGYGMAGQPAAAEELLKTMRAAGYVPQDYAYCGLIAAHSLCGDWRSALEVKGRALEDGVPISVHMYNALIAACERARQYEKAVELGRDMVVSGVSPNSATRELLEGVCKGGVAAIENQQATIAALSAAVAAAGTVMIRAGIF